MVKNKYTVPHLPLSLVASIISILAFSFILTQFSSQAFAITQDYSPSQPLLADGNLDCSTSSSNKAGGCECTDNSQCASGVCQTTTTSNGRRTTGKTCTVPTTTLTPTVLTCDPVKDGLINTADYDLWLKEYTHQVNTTLTSCFLPGDNTVNILDFQVWKDISYGLKQSF